METLELDTRFADFDSGAIRIFVCYSRVDASAQRLVVDCLNLFSTHYSVTTWIDKKIILGDIWKETILEAIRRSNCALLIVSRRWFDATKDTSFIREVELPAIGRRRDNPVDRLVVLPLIIDDTPLSALESLGLHDIQASAIRIAANEEAMAIQSLQRLREWLSTMHVVRQRRQVRRSFARRLVYATLLTVGLVSAFRPGDVAARLQGLQEIDSRVGVEELDATMRTSEQASRPYRARILRSVAGKRVELLPPRPSSAPIITTQRTAVGQTPDQPLWVDLEPGVTGIVAAPSDAELVIGSQADALPPGDLVVMTLFEYYSRFLIDSGTGAFVLFVGGFVVATIRNRVLDDRALYVARQS